MKKVNLLFFFKLVLVVIFFGMIFSPEESTFAQGQICTGTVSFTNYSCSYDSFRRTYKCNNGGGGTQGCSGGGVEYCMLAVPGGCSASSSGCSVSTNTVGCTSYQPPVIQPTPYVPPDNNDGDVNDPPPPQTTYECNSCSGCVPSSGGTDYNSCSSSCVVFESGSAQCPDAPSVISTSSCPDVEDTAVEDIVMPGQTVEWTTWERPPGDTPEQRMLNSSPGTITKTYTSPGDMVTIAYMFLVAEGQPHTFYIYDETDRTYFFYARTNKPPVVFARDQVVVDRAVELGYTLITDTSGANAAYAKTIDKRVYKLPDGTNNPWKDSTGIYGIVQHAPFGESQTHIPIINCASLFRASGHGDYYSTNINTLKQNKYYCYRRQNIPNVLWPDPNSNDEGDHIAHVSGNYLGLELDFPTPTSFGTHNGGEFYWPNTNVLAGPRYEYFPKFAYVFMEKRSQWEARPDQNNQQFVPGFMRQAIIQIPIRLFKDPGEHVLHAYTALGDPLGSTPVKDENSDSGCEISQPRQGKTVDIPIYDDGTDETINIPPRCENFRVYNKATGQPIASGDKIKIGDTYSIYANALGKSKVYDFYNSNFADPHVTSSEIDTWTRSGNVNTFQIVDCDGFGTGCHNGSTETKVLKVSQTDNSARISTEYIETGENVTGKTFRVDFWARTQGSASKTIPEIVLERNSDVSLQSDYPLLGDPSDGRNVRFENFNTEEQNDTTASITLTNQWQHFSGAVTFDYDATNFTGHPGYSQSTKLRLMIKGPSDGSIVYFDDFVITGWEQPTVYYRMAPATQGPTTGYDQCDQSVWADSTNTNLSGGLFWGDMTIPENVTDTQPLVPGLYNIFAAIETRPDYVYIGNPNAVSRCGLNTDNWNDSISSTCRLQVEAVSCNETTPVAPVVNTVDSLNNSLPNLPTASGQNKFNDLRVTNSQNKIVITATPGGTTAQQNAVTSMIMYVTPYGSTTPERVIDGVKGGNIYSFTLDLAEDLTNELTINIQAINGDSCSAAGEIYSTALQRHIRLMRQRSGHLIEVPRSQITTYACTETSDTLSGDPRLIDISDSKFTGTKMTISTSNTFSTYTADPTFNVADFKKLFRSSITKRYTTDLPYNPPNNAAWRNQISTAILEIPQLSEEETYVCVNRCNPDASNASYIRCAIPGEDIPKTSVTQYTNDLNVYVAKGSFTDAWWQARGGLIYAGGNIQSDIPLFNSNPRQLCQNHYSDDVCMPFISAKAVGSGGNINAHQSAGVLIANGSSSSVTPASWATQNTGGQQIATNAQTVTNTEDYDYYHQLIDDTKDNSLAATMPTTFTAGLNSATVYDANDNLIVYQTTGDLNINLQTTTVTVPSDKKVLIFVNGNLNIYDASNANHINKITVANGGFLGFIVSGNIVIDANVGHSDPLQKSPAIKGVFLADGQIIINSKGTDVSDKKFIGEGSFIGLSGVQLNRKFDSGVTDPFDREKNSYSPVEQFLFSPSLVAKTPNFMREADLTWQEIN